VAVAFFDMDRTLLTVNSGTAWVRFLRRNNEITRWQLLRALGWAAQYHLSILDLQTVAKRLVADMAGDDEDRMMAKCMHWFSTEIRHTISPAARAAVKEHRDKGDRVVMLTGATAYIAVLVATNLDLSDVICSRLEVVDGRFTGAILEPLCFGAGKVLAAEEWAAKHGVDLADASFYTDSFSDLPMLERVGRPVAVNPDPRLSRVARKRGWPVLVWNGISK